MWIPKLPLNYKAFRGGFGSASRSPVRPLSFYCRKMSIFLNAKLIHRKFHRKYFQLRLFGDGLGTSSKNICSALDFQRQIFFASKSLIFVVLPFDSQLFDVGYLRYLLKVFVSQARRMCFEHSSLIRPLCSNACECQFLEIFMWEHFGPQLPSHLNTLQLCRVRLVVLAAHGGVIMSGVVHCNWIV